MAYLLLITPDKTGEIDGYNQPCPGDNKQTNKRGSLPPHLWSGVEQGLSRYKHILVVLSRKVSNGRANFLKYEILTESSRGSVWGRSSNSRCLCANFQSCRLSFLAVPALFYLILDSRSPQPVSALIGFKSLQNSSMCHDMTRYLSCMISSGHQWDIDKLLLVSGIISFSSSHVITEQSEPKRKCWFYFNLKDFVTNLWIWLMPYHGLLRSFLVTDRARAYARSPSTCTRSEMLLPHAFFMWPFNTVWTKMKAEDSNRSHHLYITSKGLLQTSPPSSALPTGFKWSPSNKSDQKCAVVIYNLFCTSHTPTAASWWHHLYLLNV